MSEIPLQFFIYLIYGIPSAILNLLVIICILGNKKLFAISFYQVYIYVLLVYLIIYINTYPVVKFRDIPSIAPIYVGIEQWFPPFRLMYSWQYIAFHAQQLVLIMMHFNRFTAIHFPMSHAWIWKPFHFRMTAIIIFVFCFGINYEIFLLNNYFVLINGLARTNPDNALIPVLSNWAMANLSHVYPLVSLALNMGTIAKLLYLRWFAKEQYKNQSGQSIELSLLMICLVSLLGQFGLMIYADHKTEIQANIAMATLILNLVSDCSTLCEAYIGLAVNGTLRKALFSMLSKRVSSIFHTDIETSHNMFQLLKRDTPQHQK